MAGRQAALLESLSWMRRFIDNEESSVFSNPRRNNVANASKNVEPIDSVVVDVFLYDIDTARIG